MRVVLLKNEQPVWRQPWFQQLPREAQDKFILELSEEEFKAEEKKTGRVQYVREKEETDAEYDAAVWSDIDWEQSYICLRYQDEKSSAAFQEMAQQLSQTLEDLGLVHQSSNLSPQNNSVSISFEGHASDEAANTTH